MEKAGIGVMITGAWLGLRGARWPTEFAKSGVERERDRLHPRGADAVLRPAQRHRDRLPARRARGGRRSVDDLIAEFEEAYGKVYARSARSPELGYLVTQAIVHGSVEVEKPALPDLAEREGSPPAKGDAAVRWGDGYAETDIYELDRRRGRQRDHRPGDRRVGRDHVRDPARARGAAGPPPDLSPE